MPHETDSPAFDTVRACVRTYLPSNEAIGPRALPAIVNDAKPGAGREISGAAR